MFLKSKLSRECSKSFSHNAFVNWVVTENFLNRKPSIEMETLCLGLADEKLQRKRTVGVAASAGLQHHYTAFTESCWYIVRKRQVWQQSSLINGKSERKNSTVVELRHFFYVVDKLEENFLKKSSNWSLNRTWQAVTRFTEDRKM